MLAGETMKKEGFNTESIGDPPTATSILAEDDGNRCCYFNAVQAELLLRGDSAISSQAAPIRWGKRKRSPQQTAMSYQP